MSCLLVSGKENGGIKEGQECDVYKPRQQGRLIHHQACLVTVDGLQYIPDLPRKLFPVASDTGSIVVCAPIRHGVEVDDIVRLFYALLMQKWEYVELHPRANYEKCLSVQKPDQIS